MQRSKRGQRPKRPGRVRRLLYVAAVVAVCGVGSWYGWQWIRTVPLEDVQVTAPDFIMKDEVRTLAAVDTSKYLFDNNPDDIRRMVQRHPWVREASVQRIPNGILRIRVHERVPVARLINSLGRLGPFVDAEGWTMPGTDATAFDVPLVHGIDKDVERVTQELHPAAPELLSALAHVDGRTDALLSEIVLTSDGHVTAYLSPAADQQSIRVLLGSRGLGEKFARLTAFWNQAVLPDQVPSIAEIDLRFDSQVVVRDLL